MEILGPLISLAILAVFMLAGTAFVWVRMWLLFVGGKKRY